MKKTKRKLRGRAGTEVRRLLLAGLLCLGLCACGRGGGAPAATAAPRPSAAPASPQPTAAPSSQGTGLDAAGKALTIATAPFSGRIDPFDAAEGADLLLLRLTQTPLLCRSGDGSFPEAAEGVGAAGLRLISRVDGSTVLRIAMREDVRFADGSYADADDLLFTLYVLLDPDYDGDLPLGDCAVAGLGPYRTHTSPEIYARYKALWPEAAAGEGKLADIAADCLREAWDRSLRRLTERCARQRLEECSVRALGIGAEEARQEEGALRAFALWCTGLAEAADAHGSMKDLLGNRWEPAAGVLPDEEAMYLLFSACYGSAGALDEALGLETEALAEEAFIRRCGAADPENAPSPMISGVTRLDDYTVDLLLEPYSPEDPARLGQLWLVSMEAWGDEALYRPGEGSFGFAYGDLSALRARVSEPVPGAGAFDPMAAEDGLRLAANPWYYGGVPRVAEIRFAVGPEDELLQTVSAGLADLVCLPGSPERFAEARSLPDLAIRSVSAETWGVLCLERATLCVRDDPESGESAALRKAVLRLAAACCRDSAAAYFGGAAQLPLSEETEESALEAARLLLAQLPEEAELRFTALVPARGRGDHPCWEGMKRASALLAELGVELRVLDAGEEEELRAALEAGEGDVWAAEEALGGKPGPEGAVSDVCRAVYQRLDLLAVNALTFDLLSLPVELTWARDHISVVETLELK